jgi:archaellum biogenesis protein FlaJ (TadC family)
MKNNSKEFSAIVAGICFSLMALVFIILGIIKFFENL